MNRVTYKSSQAVSRLIMGTASEGVRNKGNRQWAMQCYIKKLISKSQTEFMLQTALSQYSQPIKSPRTVNLFCFKQSSFIGDIKVYTDTLVSWDNYFKGFCRDVANRAPLSPNVSSDRTQMYSHFCVFRNLFTSQYTGSLQMK